MKQAGLISGPPSQGKEDDDGMKGKGALLRRIRPDTGGQQAGAKNVDGGSDAQWNENSR
ncbi:hypothetical protein [Enterobacter hormaechei]|uniref:hypothetical protein n=1 Tax=Enterobacter hormaechei TaxID=158836 RepID=UPI00388E741C